jgi:hypothetical protein
VSSLPPPTFPKWVVPAAVVEAAEQLYAQLAREQDPAKAEKVLLRLTYDPRMERVWDELYKKKGVNDKATEEFFNPAFVTNASVAAANRRLASDLRKKTGAINERDVKLLEAEAAVLERLGDPPADPRWSEQDRAVQLFLYHSYRTALDVKPVFLSDLQAKVRKLRGVAEVLREQAATLQSLRMNDDALKLNEIASDCDDEASKTFPERSIVSEENEGSLFTPQADDPWIIKRKRGDLELRAFVADLSITTNMLFRMTLHGTLANVTNVVFDRQDMTFDTIHDMLRPGRRGVEDD